VPHKVLDLVSLLSCETGLAQDFPLPQLDCLQTQGDAESPRTPKTIVLSGPPPGLAEPIFDAATLPSIGSQWHVYGRCKPCSFLHTRGCENGFKCEFCHLCDSDARKRRRQAKLEAVKECKRARLEKKLARAAPLGLVSALGGA